MVGGLSATRLGRLHDVMASYVDRRVVPGLVTLVSRRGEVHVDAIGHQEVDGGPIVAQAAVPVREDDTVETLSARILEAEHALLPRAVALVLAGKVHVDGRRAVISE